MAISPIPEIDAIEAAQVCGWTVLLRKGEFATADRVALFELDTALPSAECQYQGLDRQCRACGWPAGYLPSRLEPVHSRRLGPSARRALRAGLAEGPGLDLSRPSTGALNASTTKQKGSHNDRQVNGAALERL